MKKSEDLDKEINAEIKLIYEIKLLDWKDKNDRACALITLIMKKKSQAHLRNIKVVSEIWFIIKNQYDESDVIILYSAFKKLTQFKQSNFRSIREYADAFKKIFNKCLNVDKEFSDWKLDYLFLLDLNEDLESYVFDFMQTIKINKMSLSINDMTVALSDHDYKLH